MGTMQQTKGKTFENLVARIISAFLGVQVVRNLCQYGQDAGRDLLADLPFCFQCQHAKQPDPWEKLREAKGSAIAEKELPVAIIRKNRRDIIVVMEMNDWLLLVEKALLNK